MITTLTPNPSFDRTIAIGRLVPGEVHRAQSVTTEAGGKGINVARALANAGNDAIAVLPAGEEDARAFAALLAPIERLTLAPIAIDGRVRTNVSLTDPDGETTKINEPGPTLDASSAEDLIDATIERAHGSAWLVASGSLAPGLPTDFYAQLTQRANDAGLRVAIDTSGEPLVHASRSGCALLKPNAEELESLVGASLPTLGDVLDAARSVIAGGIEQLLVSLGAAGALLVTEDLSVLASTPATAVKNTVGAGDATLAGFIHEGRGGDASLVNAVAWGRAAVRSSTTAFAIPNETELAQVMVDPHPDPTITVENS